MLKIALAIIIVLALGLISFQLYQSQQPQSPSPTPAPARAIESDQLPDPREVAECEELKNQSIPAEAVPGVLTIDVKDSLSKEEFENYAQRLEEDGAKVQYKSYGQVKTYSIVIPNGQEFFWQCKLYKLPQTKSIELNYDRTLQDLPPLDSSSNDSVQVTY